MPTVDEYLFKFDFRKLQDQVNSLSRLYTDFGTTLREVISSVSDDVSDLNQKTADMSTSIGNISPQVDRSYQSMKSQMDTTLRDLDSFSSKNEKIANDMNRLAGARIGAAEGAAVGSPQLIKAQAAADTVLDMAAIAKSVAAEVEKKANDIEKQLKSQEKDFEKSVDSILAYVKAELKGAAQAVGGLIKYIPGVGGSVMDTLIGWMVLGVQEDARRAAEKGEMRNVFEATGENLYGPNSSANIVNWFTGFQEKAQWFYGISKEQSQAVADSLVKAGYKSKELKNSVIEGLEGVEKNAALASIALDKHLEMATGTSMTNIIDIVANYGGKLDDVTESYAEMVMSAQDTAIGIDRFINTVMAGSSAMQQYGIDTKNVANVMMNIYDYYIRMGIDPHLAGGRAARMVEGLMGGMAKLDEGTKSILASKMFPEIGYAAALVKLEEGASRVGTEESKDFITKFIVSFGEFVFEGRDRVSGILFAKHLGLDYQTAADYRDAYEELKKHRDFSKLGDEHQKRLTSALQTEGERISSLQKTERELINALRGVGTGLLRILSGILGTITLLVTAIPRLVGAMMSPDQTMAGEMSEIKGDMNSMLSHMRIGVYEASRNLMDVPEIVRDEFKGVFDPILAAIGGGPLGDIKQAWKLIEQNLSQLKDDEKRKQLEYVFGRDVGSIGSELERISEEPQTQMPTTGGSVPGEQAKEGKRNVRRGTGRKIKEKAQGKDTKIRKSDDATREKLLRDRKNKVKIPADKLKQSKDNSDKSKRTRP